MIKSNLQRYTDAPTRYLKGNLVAELQEKLLEAGARFVKKDKGTNRWFQLDKNSTHEKIGHAIRDNLKRQQKKKSISKVTGINKLKPIVTKSNVLTDALNTLQNNNDGSTVNTITSSPRTSFSSSNYENTDVSDSLYFTDAFIQDPAPGLPVTIEVEYPEPVYSTSNVHNSLRLMQADLYHDLSNEDSLFSADTSTSSVPDSLHWIEDELSLDLSNEESLENFQFWNKQTHTKTHTHTHTHTQFLIFPHLTIFDFSPRDILGPILQN